MTITSVKHNPELKDVGESIELHGLSMVDREGHPYSVRFLFNVRGYTTVDPQKEVCELTRIIMVREDDQDA